jgi:ribonuclease P protein component
MRFRTEQHLRSPREIRAVRERGQRLECRSFTLWWKRRGSEATTSATSDPGPQPRVCVIASTAAVGQATDRNRAKRRLREVFRHQQVHLPADCDLLMIARRDATTCPLAEMESRFVEACRRIASTPAR